MFTKPLGTLSHNRILRDLWRVYILEGSSHSGFPLLWASGVGLFLLGLIWEKTRAYAGFREGLGSGKPPESNAATSLRWAAGDECLDLLATPSKRWRLRFPHASALIPVSEGRKCRNDLQPLDLPTRQWWHHKRHPGPQACNNIPRKAQFGR